VVVAAAEGPSVRVLVTGAAGQLGTDLVRHCAEQGHDVIACDAKVLDLGDRGSVMGAVKTLAPDVVVNAGAWTAVDACEADPDRAWRTNALGVRWVAAACRDTGAHLVQLSTDYVFDGTKDGPYVEWDRPNPLSAYGRSKLAGEQEALEGCPGAAVVRTSWVSGAAGRNVVRTVLERAAAGDPLAFVDDQRGRPTFTADLAVAVRRLAVTRVPGRYHVTNGGETTWYGFVRDVLEAAGHDPDGVRPIRTSELHPPRPAARPANAVLDGVAWREAGFEPLPHYRDGLRRLLEELGVRTRPLEGT
jgi:dTDP-4-dehydrorhamnose reductase